MQAVIIKLLRSAHVASLPLELEPRLQLALCWALLLLLSSRASGDDPVHHKSSQDVGSVLLSTSLLDRFAQLC